MAIGDALQAIGNVAATGTLNLQPGSGVEAVLTGWASDGGTDQKLQMYNGTIAVLIVQSTANGPLGDLAARLMLTNTNYARIENTNGSTAYDSALTAVQTK